MKDVHPSVLRIAQILDRSTIVATYALGDQRSFSEGEEMLVLAIGNPVPGTDVPLVLPKASLLVISSNHAYVTMQTEMRPPEPAVVTMADIINLSAPMRKQLPTSEEDLTGNPARRPIAVGDVVIPKYSLSTFVDALAGGDLKLDKSDAAD